MVSSSYAIGDARFAIRSTSHAFGEWVRDVLGAYEVEDVEEFLYSVVTPEPSSGGRQKEFSILYKGSSAIVRTLDPVAVGRALLAEAEALRFHERDDAVYVLASMMDIGGVAALTPQAFVPSLSSQGRRLTRFGARLPDRMTVALDISTAEVVPVRPTLEVPRDALERLRTVGGAEPPDDLYVLDEPTEVDVFLVPAAEPETPLRPVRRGYALAALSSAVLNFEKVGGEGLAALGGLVERAECYEMAWSEPVQAVEELSRTLTPSGGRT